MHEITEERTKEGTNRRADKQRNDQTDGRVNSRMSEHTNGQTNELMNRRNIGANTNTRERYTTQNEIVRFMFHLKQQRGQ